MKMTPKDELGCSKVHYGAGQALFFDAQLQDCF
jgi:hypothetical protein